MVSTNRLAEIAAAIGEPARAGMLCALLDGRALTAAELAGVAGVSPQTASTHLGRMVDVGLITVQAQGRHRYHRLANREVARLLETLMQHASIDARPRRLLKTGPRDVALRRARTCYDHFAGRLGVTIADAFLSRGFLEIDDDLCVLTASGLSHLERIGISLPRAQDVQRSAARPLCRMCLDWSERRVHLAGRVGAALCKHSFDAGWVRRIEGSRAVTLTPSGKVSLPRAFKLPTGWDAMTAS